MKKPERLVLGLILVLSAFLLWFDLSGPSLWGDEAASFKAARRTMGEMLRTLPKEDPHPPLPFIVLNLWRRAFGYGELGARVLFTLPVLLTVWLVYLIARHLYSDERTALIAAYLVAISPLIVMFGRMIRYYSFGLCGVALSVHAFLLLREKWTRGRVAYYLATTLLLMYSSYLVFAVLLVQNAMGFIWRKAHLGVKRWLLTQAALVVGYTPWWLVLVGQVVSQATGEFSGTVADFNLSPAAIPLKMVYGFCAFAAGETLLPWRLWASLSLVTGMICALAGVIKGRLDRRTAMLASLVGVSLLCVAVITTYIAARMSFIYMAARTFFAAPYLWILAAAGITALRARRVQWIALALITAANVHSLTMYYQGKDFVMPTYAVPWKQALADVNAACGPDAKDVLVTDEEDVVEYYIGEARCRKRPYRFELVTVRPDKPELLNSIKARLRAHPDIPVHLLITGRDSTESKLEKAGLLSWINEHYEAAGGENYVPIDPTMKKIKGRLLQRRPYDYKLRWLLMQPKKTP